MIPSYSDDWATLYTGNAAGVLRELPERSVHSVVTSPPYFGLRSYLPSNHEHKGLEGGTQETPGQYVAWLVEVFRGVRRVLRDDGLVFLNLGDCYAANRTYQVSDSKHKAHDFAGSNETRVPPGLKPKDLLMIPARVAIALQEDGWYLRSKLTWIKKAPMPESVADRFTSATEEVFMLAKSKRYFFDSFAVRETDGGRASGNGFRREHRVSYGGRGQDAEWQPGGGRNMRNYLFLGPEPYRGSHYAVMPTKLVLPLIRCSTSERGVCAECGAPWERVVERGESRRMGGNAGVSKGHAHGPMDRGGHGQWDEGHMPTVRSVHTTGWRPTCGCLGTIRDGVYASAIPLGRHPVVPAIVLDPFMGSGTTALAARKLGRKSVGIDLDERNATLVEKRLGTQGVLL